AVRANDPKNYSVMYFSFIDPDYVDLPLATRTNASVLYWIETRRKGLANGNFSARYIVVEGRHTTLTGHLSLTAGKPRTWSLPQDKSESICDYMSGGFFWKDSTLNYLAHWIENDSERLGIHANVVSLPYRRLFFYGMAEGRGATAHCAPNHTIVTDWVINPGGLAQWTHIASLGEGGIFVYNRSSGAGSLGHIGADGSILTDW